jgi:hypothetical protein
VGQSTVSGSMLPDRLHGGHEPRSSCNAASSPSPHSCTFDASDTASNISQVCLNTTVVNIQHRSSCTDRRSASADPDPPFSSSVGPPFRIRLWPISALASVNTDRGIVRAAIRSPQNLFGIRDVICESCGVCTASSVVPFHAWTKPGVSDAT